MNNSSRPLAQTPSLQGVFFACYCMLLFGLVLLPLPLVLIDILLALLLFCSFFFFIKAVTSPIENLTFFPRALIFVSLFRSALAVALARTIIPFAGSVDNSSGAFLGLISSAIFEGDALKAVFIFVVISAIAILLISKGGARIAEVAARFSLDSLPGLQLSIEGQLRSGQISSEEANKKRSNLNTVSHFYGSMDGTIRYLQSDILIAIFITIFSLIIGAISLFGNGGDVLQDIQQVAILSLALGSFLLLNSILTSLAGILVLSKESTISTGENEIKRWILQNRTILLGISVILILFSFLPWFPFLPLFIVALLVVIVAYLPQLSSDSVSGSSSFIKNTYQRLLLESNRISALDDLDATVENRNLKFEINLSKSLWTTQIVDQNKDSILSVFVKQRENIYRRHGVLLPEISLHLDDSLDDGRFAIAAGNTIFITDFIEPNTNYFCGNAHACELFGAVNLTEQINPYTGTVSCWVRLTENQLQLAKKMNLSLYSVPEYFGLALLTVYLSYIENFLGVTEVKLIISSEKKRNHGLTEEVFDNKIVSYAEFAELLRRLIREHFSIFDIKNILEAVLDFHSFAAEYQDREDWFNELHSYVRLALARLQLKQFVREDQTLTGFFLGSDLEKQFKASLASWQSSKRAVPLDPDIGIRLRAKLKDLFDPLLRRGETPIILFCDTNIRYIVQQYLASVFQFPGLVMVISFQEMQHYYKLEILGEVVIN